jgi:hypothetical protein
MAIARLGACAFTLLSWARPDRTYSGAARELGRALFDLFAMLALTGTVTLVAYKCWPLSNVPWPIPHAQHTLESRLALVQIPGLQGWICVRADGVADVFAAAML